MIYLNQSCPENDASQITLSCSYLGVTGKGRMQFNHTNQLQLKNTLKYYLLWNCQCCL